MDVEDFQERVEALLEMVNRTRRRTLRDPSYKRSDDLALVVGKLGDLYTTLENMEERMEREDAEELIRHAGKNR